MTSFKQRHMAEHTNYHGSTVGYGKSCASFGEIIQGRLSDGEDFLVTLPVELWSRCELRCSAVSGHSVVKSRQPGLSKSVAVAEAVLKTLGLTNGLQVGVTIQRDMPCGKGLSSSTADMLAVVRAMQDALDIKLSNELISELFARVEPHEGLHYPGCVAYNHRQGRLLKVFGYTPDFQIIAVDAGHKVSTIAYNQGLSFSAEDKLSYDVLYHDLVNAFSRCDDAAIARCATRSAELHVGRTGNRLLADLLRVADKLALAGVIATHSGTCGGLLLAGNHNVIQQQHISNTISAFGRVFGISSLR